MDALRNEWAALIDLAEEVKTRLLSKQRVFFEREVDKQVKAFVVETIQFRNSFDTEGPLVPGLLPNEAVTRLGKRFGGSCVSFPVDHNISLIKYWSRSSYNLTKRLRGGSSPYLELDQLTKHCCSSAVK